MSTSTIKTIIAAVLAATILIILAACSAPKPSETYASVATVTEVNYDTDTVICIDAAGNLWEFTETDDWQVGDLVALLMDNNGTSNIYDDIILHAYYGG